MKSASEALHEMNVHAIVSVWPDMNAGGRNHAEFTYGAFNPEARKLYWLQAETDLYSGGFDGWWCDSTEPFPGPDWGGEVRRSEERCYELVGKEHEKYLDPAVANAFTLVHAQGIYENQPQKPLVNLTRSGWAGIQKYGAILWAGDTSATWAELGREITRGRQIGRPQVSKEDIPATFLRHYPAYKSKQLNVSELARVCDISRTTAYKYIGLLEA